MSKIVDGIEFPVQILGDINPNIISYIYVETKKDNAVYELFNTFMEHSLKTGYTFPDLKIHIIR